MTSALSTPRIAVLASTDANALAPILGALPASLELAIVAASHDAAQLADRVPPGLAVVEVHERAQLEAGRVFVVPPARGATIRKSELVVEDAPRVSLDRLFRSLAIDAGPRGIAVLLGRRDDDGLLGVARVRDAGGLTLAEAHADWDTAVPGGVDLVLPAGEIAARLTAIARNVPALDELDAETVRELAGILRARAEHALSVYTLPALQRALAHRMEVCCAGSPGAYVSRLRSDAAEAFQLVRALSTRAALLDHPVGLPGGSTLLEHDIVARVIAGRSRGDVARVWMMGCGTGEEAYAIAMALHEAACALDAPPRIQVIATDVDQRALAQARAGAYPHALSAEVPAERLARHARHDSDGYKMGREIQQTILFAPHDLLRDPPFSRVDLVACRLRLGDLVPESQQQLLDMIAFALRSEGLLWLARPVHIGGQSFVGLDPEQRLYARSSAAAPPRAWARTRSHPPVPAPGGALAGRHGAGMRHHRLVELYAPPSVLVDDELEILHVSEHAGDYLRHGIGHPSRQLMRLVHPALRAPLRAVVVAAQHAPPGGDPRERVGRTAVRFEDAGVSRSIELSAMAAELGEPGSRGLLIMFDERNEEAGEPGVQPAAQTQPALQRAVEVLEDELVRARAQLRLASEEQDTAIEAMHSANMELQALNQELTGSTRELAHRTHELTAANQELTALNCELARTAEETRRAHADLENLVRASRLATVFLDRDLRVVRYTPACLDVLPVSDADVGRPVRELRSHLEGAASDEIVVNAARVLDGAEASDLEATSTSGRRYLVRVLPYRTQDGRVDGVVLTFIDITELHAAQAAVRASEVARAATEERLRIALRAAPVVMLGLTDGQVAWGYAYGAELTSSADALALFTPESGARLLALGDQVARTHTGVREELELSIGGQARTHDVRIEPTQLGVIAVGFDIMPSKLAQASLIETDRKKDEFLATLSHELRNPLTPLMVALDVAKLAPDDPAQQAEARAIMERQVHQLSQLVDELLDLSRITQGKIEIRRARVDMVRVAEQAIESTHPLVTQHGHHLRVHAPAGPAHVIGDETRLVQILTNLLTNAAKYTPDGGEIDLAIVSDVELGRVEVHVRDNGIGIPAGKLEHIFEVFYQSRDALGRSQGGLGIGLNLVSRLVDLHGGTVRAISDGPGTGSEFVIDLPVSA